MFPLVYGCSKALKEEVVGVDDAIRKWAGKGDLIPKGEVAAPKRKHQVSSFRLQDPTKPGHRRFIALWLVDPFQRIISTANVPPQQMNWWLDSVLGDTLESRNEALSKLPAELVLLMKEKGLDAEALSEAKLPQELMSLTTEYFTADGDGLLMSLEEAKEYRPKLMAERSAFVETADEGYHQYSIASVSIRHPRDTHATINNPTSSHKSRTKSFPNHRPRPCPSLSCFSTSYLNLRESSLKSTYLQYSRKSIQRRNPTK